MRDGCRVTESPLGRGGSHIESHPGLPGWVTANHEETHYVLPVITSHPSWESGGGRAGGCPGRPTRQVCYLSTVKLVVSKVPDVRVLR